MRIKARAIPGLFFFFLLTFLAAGCGLNSASPEVKTKQNQTEKLVVGVAHADFKDPWLGFLLSGVKEYEAEHKEMKAIYSDAGNDSNKQIEQAEALIEQDVDSMMVIPVDMVAAELILEKAKRADIPVVLVNRESLETKSAYVGSDALAFGKMQMEEVAKRLGGKGNVAIMNGQIGHPAQKQRTEGNKQVIERYKNMYVILEGTAGWNREQGKALMQSWLQSGQKIDAVVANNDEMAIGAIQAAEEAGKLGDIVFAGIDGTPDALAYVKAGKLAATVFQDAKGQGQGGIEAAVKLAKGEQVKETTYVEEELVVKENAGMYIEKWK